MKQIKELIRNIKMMIEIKLVRILCNPIKSFIFNFLIYWLIIRILDDIICVLQADQKSLIAIIDKVDKADETNDWVTTSLSWVKQKLVNFMQICQDNYERLHQDPNHLINSILNKYFEEIGDLNASFYEKISKYDPWDSPYNLIDPTNIYENTITFLRDNVPSNLWANTSADLTNPESYINQLRQELNNRIIEYNGTNEGVKTAILNTCIKIYNHQQFFEQNNYFVHSQIMKKAFEYYLETDYGITILRSDYSNYPEVHLEDQEVQEDPEVQDQVNKTRYSWWLLPTVVIGFIVVNCLLSPTVVIG